MRILTTILLIITPIFLASCGGGGGGGSASEGNPASIDVDASPRKIDSGDRITVTLRLSDIRRNDFPGIIVKVLHPSGLRYVANSAVLATDDEINEEFTPTSADADEASYLLFYIDTAEIPESDRSAIVQFVFRGLGAITKDNGTIAVDLDVVNSDRRASFDAANPLFTSLDSTRVEVTG